MVNNDSFPLFQIKSPQQPDGWSCGFFFIRSIIAIVSRSGEFLPFTYNELLGKDVFSYRTDILNVTKDVLNFFLFRHFQSEEAINFDPAEVDDFVKDGRILLERLRYLHLLSLKKGSFRLLQNHQLPLDQS